MSSPQKAALLVATFVLAGVAPAHGSPPTCPSGKRPTISGCASTAPSLHATTRSDETAAPGASASPAHPDAPETSLRPDVPLVLRSRALLVEEIARLEALLQKTSRKSPDRAALVLRLANGYAELTALADREHTVREIQLDVAREELDRAERERARTKTTDEATKKPARQMGPPRRPIRL